MKRLFLLLSVIMLNTSSIDKIYCEIKGSVKKPGVYEIKSNYNIQDVINEAGGLTKDAYTKNINLSKKVNDEMVIYIFNKDEIKKEKEIKNCKCEPIYKYSECEEINPTTSITSKIEKETTSQITATTKPIEPTTTKLLININTCTKEDLLNIKGLGEIKAAAIIDYRNSHGLFNSIEEIMDVHGIGESTFEKIKEYITI